MGGVIKRYVYRYPHNNYYFSLLHLYLFSSFFGSSIPTSLFIFKCFFVLVYVIFVQYIANFAQRSLKIVQKSRSREYN